MASYRLFPTNPTPSTPDGGYGSPLTCGMKFKVTSAANATAIWFYKAATNTGTHTAAIWNNSCVIQGTSVTFSGESASGWQSVTLSPPISLTVGAYYTVGVYMPAGHFSRQPGVWLSSKTNGPLYGPAPAEAPQPLQNFGSPLTCPTFAETTDNYGIDVEVGDVTTPPTAPTSLVANTVSSSRIDLTWTASTGTGITGYRVERCSGAGCSTFTEVGTPTLTSFSDTGLLPSTSYSYRVRASGTGGLSGYSSTATAVTSADVPSPPTAPTSLVTTVQSSTRIDLIWTASTGTGITGYRLERCSGAGCSTFVEIGTPTLTAFSDTGLLPSTSYSYRVRASGTGGLSGYSSTATATTADPAPPSEVRVRSVSSIVTFAGLELDDVISARGQVSADSGWPTCSVFVTAKPATGNEEDDLTVVAGAGNNVTRFTGKVRRFRPSAFPKGVEIVAMGTLAYAAEWAPAEDLLFDDEFPSGATDQALVGWALGFVPGISYVVGDIQGTGITLGTEVPEAFDWRAGVSAWQYVQQLDQATLYRTYQQRDGTIRRVQLIGHPSSTATTFTLTNHDLLEGSTGERDTEQTRNAAIVRGYDYGNDLGPTLGVAYGANDFQGDAATAATRHPEEFSSSLIEDGNDEDGTPLGNAGLDAQDIAEAILNDVNKEFVAATIQSWRDDTHGPGQTCLLDSLDRLAIGEKMWVVGYGWEVADGWTSTYTLSGGGLEQPYTPPPV